MAVIKVYTRINWLNKSESLTTPLGKTNLNKMDKAINLIDDEVVSMSAKLNEIDTTKVSADQLNNMVTDVGFNDKNGVISITKYNGTVLNIDTAMEKIAVNFEYNAQTQQLILTLESGEKQYIDMSALITQYEFKDTDTIAFSVDSDGKVSASVKSGSITKAMLSSEIMSAITLSENNAAASAQTAAQSATNADMDAKLAQSYSIGKSGIRDGEETDNAKYYCNLSESYKDNAAISEQNAKTSETNAKASEMNATISENNAKLSETIVEKKASEVLSNAETAVGKANEANAFASAASESEKNAKKSEKLSRSYAIGDADGTRENEDTDNSKWYAQQAEKYAKQAEDIAGGNFISESEKGVAGGVAVLDANLAVAKAVADEDGNNIKTTYATQQQVPNLVKVDDKTITKDEDGTLHGAMSIEVDSELSEESENPVQNKVITESLKSKSGSNHTHPYAGSNTAGGIANSSNLVYATSHKGEWYQNSQWDGTYFQTNYKHGDDVLPMRVGYSGYSDNSGKVNNYTVNSDVPANAVFTDTTYSDATTSAHGLMSVGDKSKLDGIATGANKTTILNSLAATTTGYALDAVQGKALNDAIASLKKSVSDGKSAIASAITAKGVSTASDASFSTMATNIKNISGTSASDIAKSLGNISYKENLGFSSSIKTIINAGYPTGYPFVSSSSEINAWYLLKENQITKWGNYAFYNFVNHGGSNSSAGTFDVDMYVFSSKETKSYKNVSSITLPTEETAKWVIYI